MEKVKTLEKSILEQVHIMGLSCISWLNKFLEKQGNFKSCILCYHAIGGNDWGFSTELEDFIKQIDYLKKTRNIVPLSEIISSRYKNKTGQVAITFDDGYENVYKYALPLLKKYGLPATVFVIGDGKNANRGELGSNEELLSIEQIKELHKLGWEIGFHSKTHAYFRKLNEKELREEIVEGKKEFEQKLGFKLRYFAYPKGIYSEEIIKIVKEAGFKTAFTVDGGAINKNSDKYRIKRVVVDGDRNMQQFDAILSGAGLFYGESRISVLKIQDYLKYKIHSQTVKL